MLFCRYFSLLYLPCGGLYVDGAASARQRAFHPQKEAALCTRFLGFLGSWWHKKKREEMESVKSRKRAARVFISNYQRFYGFSLQLQPADLICIKRRHKGLKGLLCGEIKKNKQKKEVELQLHLRQSDLNEM